MKVPMKGANDHDPPHREVLTTAQMGSVLGACF